MELLCPHSIGANRIAPKRCAGLVHSGEGIYAILLPP